MSLAEFIYTDILKPKPLKALANAVLLRIIPEKIRVDDATLHLDPSDPVVSGALTLRVFEPSELEFFQEHCRGDMTLVDIGANVGLYTSLAIHSLNEKACIISFEPHPKTFGFLQKNIETNIQNKKSGAPKVNPFQLAAAPEDTDKELRLNPENRGDNRLYQGTYNGKLETWDTVSVHGRPVDNVLEELGITEVNFVKIDIQGYEQNAMAGFKKTLARSKQAIIMTEYWPKGLREAGGDPKEYLQNLKDLGFTLYELKEKPRGQVVPLEDWDQLINRLPERKYANIIGVKGYSFAWTK